MSLMSFMSLMSLNIAAIGAVLILFIKHFYCNVVYYFNIYMNKFLN